MGENLNLVDKIGLGEEKQGYGASLAEFFESLRVKRVCSQD